MRTHNKHTDQETKNLRDENSRLIAENARLKSEREEVMRAYTENDNYWRNTYLEALSKLRSVSASVKYGFATEAEFIKIADELQDIPPQLGFVFTSENTTVTSELMDSIKPCTHTPDDILRKIDCDVYAEIVAVHMYSRDFITQERIPVLVDELKGENKKMTSAVIYALCKQ